MDIVTAGGVPSTAVATTNGMRTTAVAAAAAAAAAAVAVNNNNNTSTGTMTAAAGPQEHQQQQQQTGSSGTPVRMLQLDQSVIQAIADRCRTVRPDQTAVVEVAATVPASELPAEGYAIDGGRTVGHACAKCQLAFPDNGGLAAHQQRDCRTTGSVALAHPAYGCRSCGVGANGETNTYGTVHALRTHIETAHRGGHYGTAASSVGRHQHLQHHHHHHHQQQQQHQQQQLHMQQLQPSPNLSDEMEDVVNQITALAAAKAVGRSPSPRDLNSDSNANLFCSPSADKKSSGTAASTAATAASKMHKFTAPPATCNVAPAVPSSGQ
ncbi:hypothetical protein ACI65C_011341 [Semiaphis heraclei]